MKKKILILEDNYYKYFTLMQLLQSLLKIRVHVVAVQSFEEACCQVHKVRPSKIYGKIRGGAVEFMEMLKQKGLNRRSGEVIIVAMDFPAASQCLVQLEKQLTQINQSTLKSPNNKEVARAA